MNSRIISFGNIALMTVFFLAAACSHTFQNPEPSLVQGLDHIPVAVMDLEASAEQYRRLGFTLKPGRIHENGLRNEHIKFPDGTAIELITAPTARDPLTAE